MTLVEVAQTAGGFASPVAVAAFVWVAMELKYIRRDVDRAHDRVNDALNHIDRLRDHMS